MGKIEKRKTKIKVKGEWQGHAFADSYLKNTTEDFEIADTEYDYAKSLKEEDQANHEINEYKTHQVDHNQYFNDDLGIDEQDYEVEQEKYVVESEDAQPIAVDRYFKRFGKSRRTPR